MRIDCILLCLVSSCAVAQQSRFDDYDTVRDEVFWPMLYSIGGATLYCAATFDGEQRVIDGRILTVEHAFPADWIATHHGCENRDDCDVAEYKFAAADLHNLWPAIGNINSSRQDLPLGEIPGEQRRFEEYCPDFERTSGETAVVEPRDEVKGDMARSLLYMVDGYGLELPPDMELEMLLKWHFSDPPDDMERWRNFAIERLQGSRNPYIR